MNTKILKLFTGISVLAAAGLLCLVPANTCRASVPSSAPSSVPSSRTSHSGTITSESLYVADHRIDTSASPVYTSGSINWTFDVETSNYPHRSQDPHIEIEINSDSSQTISAYIPFVYSLVSEDSGTASFNVTFDNVEYSGSVDLAHINPSSSPDLAYGEYWKRLHGVITGDFRTVIPPATSGTTTSGTTTSGTTTSGTTTPETTTPGSTTPETTTPGTTTPDPATFTIPSGAPLSDDEASARAFAKAIDEIVNQIKNASEGQVIFCKGSGALSYKILAALAKTKGVTFIYTYEYEGIIFQSTITSELAAAAYSPEIEWYGPCFLAEHFPTGIVGVRL